MCRPCGLRHTVVVTEGGGTEEELAQYAKVGAEDWTAFLIHRAKELRSGTIHTIMIP